VTGGTGAIGATGATGATGAPGAPTFFPELGANASTSLDTSAGRLSPNCNEGGTFNIAFRAPSVAVDLWIEDNGSLSRQNVAANSFIVPYDVSAGNHHILFRATTASATTEWDVLVNTTGTQVTGTCAINVGQSTASLTPLPPYSP
jgi:hypothetical protein